MEPSTDLLNTSSAALGSIPGQAVAKAYFVGEANGSQSNVVPEPEPTQALFQRAGALQPLYSPDGLAVVFENSSCLRSCVDAMVTNVDSYGHQITPTIDLAQLNADAKILNALRIERKDKKLSGDTSIVALEPTPEEVEKRKEELKVAIAEERARLEVFFDNATVDMPFSGPEGLRGLTRQDLEIQGNAYWEVLRNAFGQVAQFNHVPAVSMRLMSLDKELVEVETVQRVSEIAIKKIKVRKRFRRFVQSWEGNSKVIYFKEFEDPRVVSASTGSVFKTVDELKSNEGPEAQTATEIFWFKISSQRSVYGAPRWIGTLLAVLGNRQSEEGNFIYFENRSVPPLAVLVSGGRLHKDSVALLENHITNNIKGARNNHKILILEADKADSSQASNGARMKIEIVPLTDSQQKDALFQAYDERNTDKVGQSFRLPRLLRGDVRDFNRSTAAASIDFAEVQVFGPIRQEFDWRINKRILPVLGACYHVFKSNAPTVRDPTALAEMIERLAKANVLTPEEARALCAGVFNQELPTVDAPWVKQPIALSLAGRDIDDNLATPEDESARYQNRDLKTFNQNGGMSASGSGSTQSQLGVGKAKDDDEDEDEDEEFSARRLLPIKAKALIKLHQEFTKAEREQAAETWNTFDREVVQLPIKEFEALFDKE